MSLRSPLGRVRGLGSANEGVGHFVAQRLTGLLLIPLGFWFACSVIGLTHADFAQVKGWMGRPGNAALLLLTMLATVHHGQLGVQVVIEDYVHCECKKVASLIATKLIAAFLAVFMTVSVLKVAVGV